MATNNTNEETMNFETLMEQRLSEFDAGGAPADASNERLREMNKKLPEWSLEPPYSFLK